MGGTTLTWFLLGGIATRKMTGPEIEIETGTGIEIGTGTKTGIRTETGTRKRAKIDRKTGKREATKETEMIHTTRIRKRRSIRSPKIMMIMMTSPAARITRNPMMTMRMTETLA